MWLVRGSSELKHYGVLGMKWGVRKEYEPKGRKKKTNEVITGSTFGSDSHKYLKNAKIDIIDTSSKAYKKNVNDELAAIGKAIEGRYASEEDALTAFENLPKSHIRYNPTETQEKAWTNHNGTDSEGYKDSVRTVNCFQCTMAYEMRKRGYNVQAKRDYGGWDVESNHAFDVKDCFRVSYSGAGGYDLKTGQLTEEELEEYKKAAQDAYDRMAAQCIAYGDGARGMLGINYVTGGGHAMSWEVKNGEFKIIDSQGVYRDGHEIFLNADTTGRSSVYVARLDNAEALPGVTDFVEPYEHSLTDDSIGKTNKLTNKTDSEEKAAKKREAEEQAEIAEYKRVQQERRDADRAAFKQEQETKQRMDQIKAKWAAKRRSNRR